MKNIIVILLLVISFNTRAQTPLRNIYSTGIAISGLNSYEAYGPSFSNTYIRIPTRFFGFGLSSNIAFSKGDISQSKDYSLYSASWYGHLYFVPVHSSRHLVLIGAGPQLNYTEFNSSTKDDIIVQNNQTYTIETKESLMSMFYTSISFNYFLTIKQNMVAGINAHYSKLHTNSADLNQLIIGLSGGIKF